MMRTSKRTHALEVLSFTPEREESSALTPLTIDFNYATKKPSLISEEYSSPASRNLPISDVALLC